MTESEEDPDTAKPGWTKQLLDNCAEAEEGPVPHRRRVATYAEMRQMELLMLAGSAEVEPDVRAWKPGCSFRSVAATVSPDLSSRHAQRVATQIGLTFTETKNDIDTTNSLAKLLSRVVELENRIEALETLAGVGARDALNPETYTTGVDYGKEWTDRDDEGSPNR